MSHQRDPEDPEDWGPWRTETRALMAATDVALATLRTDMEGADAALHERVDEARAEAATADTAINARVDETRMELSTLANELILTNQRVTDHGTIINGLIDANVILSQRITDLDMRTASNDQAHDTQLAALRFDLDALTRRVEELEKPDEPEGTWRDQKDLIDPKFRPVLGCHTGGGSSFTRIQEALGRKIQAAPIYWKKADDPTATMRRMLDRGTLPRLELCFPHIVTSLGHKMSDGEGSFWGRVPDGGYDDILVPLLQSVGALDRPILLSLGHESDLTVEDGSSPKVEGREPTRDERCGDWEEYGPYHAHLAGLARQYAPRARIFLNFSGGYADAPERWSKMLPPAGTFDFFGWDLYNMKYVQQGAPWQSFESRLKMFGRWDWYKRNLPDVPIIIGETATCAGQEPDEDAGKWLLDMIEFMVANRWQGVGTGGGISQVHYFSHMYVAHPRCLDDNGTHKGCASGQKWAVLPQIGADERLAWA